MPIYSYKCNTCNNEIEVLESINSPTERTCDFCLQNGVESLMIRKFPTSGNFKLLGTGWYKDGYASNKSKSE